MYYLEPNENLTDNNWCKRAQNKELGKKQWKNTDLYELLHI